LNKNKSDTFIGNAFLGIIQIVGYHSVIPSMRDGVKKLGKIGSGIADKSL